MINNTVCHLTTAHPPDDVRIYQKEARSLAAAGYDVTLVAPELEGVTLEGVRWHRLPRPRSRLERFTRLMPAAYRAALASGARVVHLHDPELLFVGLSLKLRGRKVVWDAHEDLPRQILSKPWLPKIFRRPIAWVIDVLERLATRAFDAVVAATPSVARRFPARKTVVIHNYPKLEELGSAATALPHVDRPSWAVYVGGISPIRGAAEMVQAIDLVDGGAELILAGAFESEDLRQRLSELPGWKRTRFVGWLDRDQVADLLGRARVGLVLLAPLQRYQAALPVKLFEYMAAGLPFVASDFPLWKEIGREAGLFVNPQDPQAIARAIEWLLTHPQEAEAMGRRGHEAVRERYNWDREKEKLLALYKELLS